MSRKIGAYLFLPVPVGRRYFVYQNLFHLIMSTKSSTNSQTKIFLHHAPHPSHTHSPHPTARHPAHRNTALITTKDPGGYSFGDPGWLRTGERFRMGYK